MRWANDTGLPAWDYAATTAVTYQRPEGVDYTVTELLAPAYQRRLMRDHDDEIVLDVADQGHRIIGTAVHLFYEKLGAGPRTLHEERLKQVINVHGLGEFVISGATDVVEDVFVEDGGVLWDIKSCKAFAIQIEGGWAKAEWTAQCNILAWLWRQAGFRIDRCAILGMVKDWGKGGRFKEDYPKHSKVVVPVPAWTDDEVVSYIHGRIRAHEEARRASTVESLPLCGDGYVNSANRWQGGETWQKRPGFAIAKPGGSCRKLEVSRDAAEAYIARKGWVGKGYEITQRTGERIRCSDDLYCSVRQWCPRGQELIRLENEVRQPPDED